MGIKKKLINWLGGYTEQDFEFWQSTRYQPTDEDICENLERYNLGRYEALQQVQSYMRSINGEDAETWCNLVWKYVTSKIEEMTTF